MIHNIARSNSAFYSVNLGEDHSDNEKYDLSIKSKSELLGKFERFFIGPILLGYLLNDTECFVYVGKLGFLISHIDQRAWEMKYVKSKSSHIVSYLVGSDIRSPKKMKELEHRTAEENIGTYQYAEFDSHKLSQIERIQEQFAFNIDVYSDLIFTAEFDQASHLKSKTLPFMYFYPKSSFRSNIEKFDFLDRPIILHAPSNPSIKGTSLIRAAVRKLSIEGFIFDYIELQNKTHVSVLENLKRAHIVVNELYGFMPGVLGIEAMANSCALLTRADPKFERQLGEDSLGAWMITEPYSVYSNLKILLENKDLILKYAHNGYVWANCNALAERNGQKLLELIRSLRVEFKS